MSFISFLPNHPPLPHILSFLFFVSLSLPFHFLVFLFKYKLALIVLFSLLPFSPPLTLLCWWNGTPISYKTFSGKMTNLMFLSDVIVFYFLLTSVFTAPAFHSLPKARHPQTLGWLKIPSLSSKRTPLMPCPKNLCIWLYLVSFWTIMALQELIYVLILWLSFLQWADLPSLQFAVCLFQRHGKWKI